MQFFFQFVQRTGKKSTEKQRKNTIKDKQHKFSIACALAHNLETAIREIYVLSHDSYTDQYV